MLKKFFFILYVIVLGFLDFIIVALVITNKLRLCLI